MGNFLDDAARILASPMPRRRALRLLGGAIAGGILGTLGARRAQAQTCNPPCTSGRVCCSWQGTNFCITAGDTCCGNTQGCNSSQQCCTTGTMPFCGNIGDICCGEHTCQRTSTAYHVCCGSGTSAFCSATGQSNAIPICCGTNSCNASQTCCASSTCCNSGQRCSNGRCVASNS